MQTRSGYINERKSNQLFSEHVSNIIFDDIKYTTLVPPKTLLLFLLIIKCPCTASIISIHDDQGVLFFTTLHGRTSLTWYTRNTATIVSTCNRVHRYPLDKTRVGLTGKLVGYLCGVDPNDTAPCSSCPCPMVTSQA